MESLYKKGYKAKKENGYKAKNKEGTFFKIKKTEYLYLNFLCEVV